MKTLLSIGSIAHGKRGTVVREESEDGPREGVLYDGTDFVIQYGPEDLFITEKGIESLARKIKHIDEGIAEEGK